MSPRAWKILSAITLIAATGISPGVASDFSSAERFLEMNGTYQEGVVHGMLVSTSTLAMPKPLQDAFDLGIKCRFRTTSGRQRTIEELTADFDKFLNDNASYLKSSVLVAFIEFTTECEDK